MLCAGLPTSWRRPLLLPAGLPQVFRSAEYHALLYSFQQLFDRVESTKPMASRSTSAEIYVVCKGYKAPAKIDKRLLDPSALFAEAADEGPRVLDVLNTKDMQKRHRSGYEAGTGVLYKEAAAETFIASDKPAEVRKFARCGLRCGMRHTRI